MEQPLEAESQETCRGRWKEASHPSGQVWPGTEDSTEELIPSLLLLPLLYLDTQAFRGTQRQSP